jgi:4-amino-4-deoxy-L-arabinose transferase-like glycosyltransferase
MDASNADCGSAPAKFGPPSLLQRYPRILLAVATLVCLLPFIDKALHLDDPLFIWAARQMQTRWWDPYGFDVNWYGWSMPMFEVTKNPPLASAYLALVISTFGESEVWLHVAFFAPAIAAVLGTYALAQRISAFPFQAALALLATPVFLISSTTLMCDVLMLAFWIWAVVFWIRGLDTQRASLLALAGLLAGLSALTKYFGIALVPLLFAYTLARTKGRDWRWLPWFLIPIAFAGIFEWATRAFYGHGLLSEAFGYTQENRSASLSTFGIKGLAAISFAGGCCAIILICAPLLARFRTWVWGILGAVVVALLLWSFPLVSNPSRQSALGFAAQWSLFLLAGAAVLALPIIEIKRRRTAETWLLVLWVLGTLGFCVFNWTINGRSILPMAPAVAILLLRRIDDQGGPRRSFRWCLGAGMALSLVATFADYRLAASARAAVKEIGQRVDTSPKPAIWFQGHWGFQYYAQANGWRPLDSQQSQPQSGDLIVLPVNNTNLLQIPPERVERLFTTELAVAPWITTMSRSLDAGFYSDQRGPLPFAFGVVPAEKYYILRFK